MKKKKFILQNALGDDNINNNTLETFKQKLLLKLPFYYNILYSSDGKSIRTAIYMDKNIVNTVQRKEFIFQTLSH